jgi:hypothetical protein
VIVGADAIARLAPATRQVLTLPALPRLIGLSRRQRRRAIRIALTDARTRRSCLGADDTVGVYLLREMIRAGIPGYYVFHYGEERGGIGSSALARTHGDYLRAHFDRAIALDRQDTGDIVTHQSGMRTASDAFAHALGSALWHLDSDLEYFGTHGVYTDTAEYADLIPECSNLSVGYQRQHSEAETVDLAHVDRLCDVLCSGQLDTEALPVVRDPRAWMEYAALEQTEQRSLRLWPEDTYDDADYVTDDDPLDADNIRIWRKP